MSKKVFLYLYPIQEYMMSSITEQDEVIKILNKCIQRRYRDNNYDIVFALYPDKKIYGVCAKEEDKIIYTDVSFEEANSNDEKNDKKPDKYPSEKLLIEQLGKVDKLVVGGFHAQDCVKRVGEYALKTGIDTVIDLDMTDFFFNLYKDKDYFVIESYNPTRYKKYMINKMKMCGDKLAEKIFNRNYSNAAYGFNIRKIEEDER